MPGGSKILNDMLIKNTNKNSAIGKAARSYGKWKDGTYLKDAVNSILGNNKKTSSKSTTNKSKKR